MTTNISNPAQSRNTIYPLLNLIPPLTSSTWQTEAFLAAALMIAKAVSDIVRFFPADPHFNPSLKKAGTASSIPVLKVYIKILLKSFWVYDIITISNIYKT